MKHIKSIIILNILFIIMSNINAQEIKTSSSLKPNYYFLNTSINYLNWTASTEKDTPQKDFTYIELEGGAGWDWGEFYMFFDIENPTKRYGETPADNKRYALKPVLDIKLFDTNFNLHIQDYMLYSESFYVNNLVTGISYDIKNDLNLFLRPFIGTHYQKSTYYSGFNGYIGGWSLLYKFKMIENNFSISQWHEFEWGRDKEDYKLEDGTPIGVGKSYGTQGALAFWWHPNTDITLGMQYRYALYNLGYNGYQDGFIYSLKYNF